MATTWAGQSWDRVAEVCGGRFNKIGWNRIERCVRRGVPLEFKKQPFLHLRYCTFCNYSELGHQQALRLMMRVVE